MKRIEEKIILSVAALMSIFILNSCGGSSADISSAIDAIPDNARFAAVIDAQKLGKQTEEYLPADLATPLEAILESGNEAINSSEVTIFTLPKGYTLAAIKVADREKLLGALSSSCQEADGFDDFEVFDCGKRKIAVGKSICYISPDIKTIKQLLKEKREPISPIEGVRQFLANPDEAVRSASIAADLYGKKLEGLWLCRAMHFTDSSVSIDLSLMKPDGQSGQIGKLLADEIDPDVIGFIPEGCSLVAATGLQQEGAKMFGIESLLRSYIPLELNLSETGTTAWYARPAGAINADNLDNPRVWNFVSLSQSSQQAGQEVIDSYLGQIGAAAKRDPETDCYTVSFGNQTATFGYLNGYTIMGLNADVVYGNSNPYTQDFRDARLIVIVDIPKGSRLQQAAELPCGASLNVKATTDNLHAKLRLYGNSTSSLETVNEISPLKNLLPFLLGLR